MKKIFHPHVGEGEHEAFQELASGLLLSGEHAGKVGGIDLHAPGQLPLIQALPGHERRKSFFVECYHGLYSGPGNGMIAEALTAVNAFPLFLVHFLF